MRFVIQRVRRASVDVVQDGAEPNNFGGPSLAAGNSGMCRVGENNAASAGSLRRVGEIGRGFLVLIGVTHGDDRAIADKMIKKMLGLRIFEDEKGKTNLSLADVGGSLLLVSQFTLYADCRKGNRPSFTNAAAPEAANELYEYVVAQCREKLAAGDCPEAAENSPGSLEAAENSPVAAGPRVQTGIFGADMKVELLNDGPFTVILDSAEL